MLLFEQGRSFLEPGRRLRGTSAGGIDLATRPGMPGSGERSQKAPLRHLVEHGCAEVGSTGAQSASCCSCGETNREFFPAAPQRVACQARKPIETFEMLGGRRCVRSDMLEPARVPVLPLLVVEPRDPARSLIRVNASPPIAAHETRVCEKPECTRDGLWFGVGRGCERQRRDGTRRRQQGCCDRTLLRAQIGR